ncbi:MAG: hypothetical protein K9N46_17110 [Candidatus Marinimicrobia bacterium]|nr:hypothetical protein [Candidatus Neomarinimicrobiota bacterium]MCF7830352.1 hypothetical protein [Candidatus Neomarinimicrobiota bacterium]MCF7882448.1 hypothetical protein [Candidatus Neomarinimicrobiota bacterium]
MRPQLRRVTVLLMAVLLPASLLPWGFTAHKQVNRGAIQEVAPELLPFFKTHRSGIIERAREPDTRKDDHPEEGPRHYLDIDYYGEYPFEALPRNYPEAAEAYGEETIEENGLLPWRIAGCTDSLTKAFARKDTEEIIRWAAWLGHYIADAHQPLHTVLNYDGQLTGNDGIHSRYESGMLNFYFNEYEFRPRDVETVRDPVKAAFDIILESNRLNKQVIEADDIAVKPMSKQNKLRMYDYYKTERDSAYFRRLYEQTSEMTWKRLDLASSRLAEFWNYAWRTAGRPELPSGL